MKQNRFRYKAFLSGDANAEFHINTLKVTQMIQSLLEEVTVDDIMAELYFKLQVDAGLRGLDGGKGIPHKEIEKRISKWLAK